MPADGVIGRPLVLYICGWGRSGTTLMDNVLGAHPGVFTAGEVTRLWELSFVEGRRCGCGTPLLECDLWGAVLDRAFGARRPDPTRMIRMQKGPLAVLRTPGLVAAARSGRVGAAAGEYSGVLSRLYHAIAEETGCRVIIDASKRPPDAVLTAMARDVRPRLLHMVRDPRACAFSWQRTRADPSSVQASQMHRHGRLMNAAHWVSWNLLAELAVRAYPPGGHLRVRYEDFMADPRGTIHDVLELICEPATDGPFVDDDIVRLATNHTIAGNPGRFRTGEITVRLDDEWRAAQRPLDRRVTTACTLPLLRRYGYRWAAPPGDDAERRRP